MPPASAHDRQLMAWSDDLDRLQAIARQPARTCAGCRHFKAGRINPQAGMAAAYAVAGTSTR